MARLEHAHIVQVYSEKVDEATDQRLLCMQLVPGVGLEKIVASISTQLSVQRSLAATLDKPTAAMPAATWRGSDILAIIDINAALPTALDPAALPRPRGAGRDGRRRGHRLDRHPTRRSPRLRPPTRRAAPRHQAGQHPREPLRPPDARRLQHLLPASAAKRAAKCSAAPSPTWPPNTSTPSTPPTTPAKMPSPNGPTSIRSAWCSTSCSTAGIRTSHSIRASA